MILGVEYTKHAISTAKKTTCRRVKGRDHFSKCVFSTGILVLRSYFSTIALFFLHQNLYKYMYIYAHNLAVEAVEIAKKMTTLVSIEKITHQEACNKTSTKNL